MTVQLGTGTVDYESITADQPLPLYEGPQGGHHFFLHARMMGMVPGDPGSNDGPNNPTTRFQVFDDRGNRVDTEARPHRRGYRPGGGGWLELPSGRIVVVVESLVGTLIDHRVRLRVDVQDAEGTSATDEVWINAYEVPLIPGDAGPDDAGPSIGTITR
ncbi:MAG: hypothetical protein MJE77_11775 [Proteobacteria bacterium]|nr:hypothetical protein [Pseudomonadota bacterium]